MGDDLGGAEIDGADVDELEEEVEQGETLEDLLRRAIKGMGQLWTVVIIAIAVSFVAFLAMGAALFIVWNDNQTDTLHSCQRANSRAADLASLTDKVQEIVGGPGVSAKVDELAEFGRTQFVARDCTNDGAITDEDFPSGERRAG